MRNTIIILALALLAAATACDDSVDEGKAKSVKGDGKAKPTDAKTMDTKAPDAKAPDAQMPDANTPDANTPDANTPDANTPDVAAPGTPDAQAPAEDPLDADAIGQLASLAREIAAKPEDADVILEKAGMDRSEFEAAMVAVAKDQWKTDLYVTALTQADQTG